MEKKTSKGLEVGLFVEEKKVSAPVTETETSKPTVPPKTKAKTKK